MRSGSRWLWCGLPLLLASLGFDYPDPEDWFFLPREPRNVKSQSAGVFGALTAQTTLADWHDALLWENPLRTRERKTEQTWRYECVGPFCVFGNLGANSQETGDSKVAGKTGLECKVPLPWEAVVTFRSGPSVTYTDPLQPDRYKERAEWLLELQARWPIFAGIGLEYQGSAAPALSPLDRNWVNHDLRLAIPFGTAGKLRLGAKQRWDGLGDPRPSTDGPQLYLGLELTH
jgi:hypothetical protein